MKGKDKCRLLKEIRKSTAAANGIPFETEECKFKGECRGTCPKCEAELKYLNEQLERRKKLGIAAAAVVMSAGLLFSTTACSNNDVEENEGRNNEIEVNEESGETEGKKYEDKIEKNPKDKSYEEMILGGMVCYAEEIEGGEVDY